MWIPPILRVVATQGSGIPELAQAIARHVEYLRASGDWAARERARLEAELDLLIREKLLDDFRASLPGPEFEQVVGQMLKHELSPWEAAGLLLNGRKV